MTGSNEIPRRRTIAALCTAAALATVGTSFAAPPAPADVRAEDIAFDAGSRIRVEWTAVEDPNLAGYSVFRSLTPDEISSADRDSRVAFATAAADAARKARAAELVAEGIAPEDADRQAEQAAVEAGSAASSAWRPESADGEVRWTLAGVADPGDTSFDIDKLVDGVDYAFAVQAFDRDGAKSAIVATSAPATSSASAFDAKRLPLFLMLALLCGTVLLFISIARRGKPLQIRTIAGLAAVEEAVGRATEMGRSVLYINGIQDMDDLQTVAGINILGRVAKIAAEYDARVEVPTSRSLVMTAARETVQGSYLSAGRSDNYNPDLIYYVTDEQFGFVAYVSGTMVREKPAACFYMGAFFAESLILAETGNSIGAIQIAGTAMPSQLPFFVAACDYTLIGEEFFAASAYLSGQPDQLGSLKGQDMGKLLVGAILLVGAVSATLAALTNSEAISGFVSFLKNTLLGT